MSVDVIKGLAAYFATRPELVAAFHGGKLYYAEAPERSTYPYATQLLISEIPQDTSTTLQTARAQVQIGAYHASAERAADAALLLHDAYQDAEFDAGVATVGTCKYTNRALTKLEGYGPSGLDAWLASYDFEIHFQSRS